MNRMNQNKLPVFNEDMDDDEYEENLKKTLSVIANHNELNEEQTMQELRDMLGDDFEEVKQQIFDENEKKQQIKKQKQKNKQQKHKKQITHKNEGNPLNIHCEADEDFDFDSKIVDQLMQLGLATKNACIRAVLQTDSKGVNQAAEWLLNHQDDKG